MRNINRRESPRIEIQLRCHVTSPALWMRTAMFTENISRSGLLFAWRGESLALATPAIGQILTVEIELPSNHDFGQKCIHCQGAVMRIAHDPDFPRVALRINYMDFRAFHDRLRLVDMTEPILNTWLA